MTGPNGDPLCSDKVSNTLLLLTIRNFSLIVATRH